MTEEELEKKKGKALKHCTTEVMVAMKVWNKYIYKCQVAADNYYFKLGEYYKLLGDKKKQFESWSKIKDKEEYEDLIKMR